MPITPFAAFWIYVILFFVSSAATIIIAWILASRRREPAKYDVFEAGQPMDVIPTDVGIFGSIRYFAYAMAFFVLDAFVWILIANTLALEGSTLAGAYLTIYIAIIFLGLWFYISKIMEVFR